MDEYQSEHHPGKGFLFERRVFSTIKKLEEMRFARELKLHDQVRDYYGNIRKIDLTFILSILFVEILVSVECKSRERSISLDEIDQIKTFKREIAGRNIFWLVYEGDIGKNAKSALKGAGISFYSIEELEGIIDDICSRYEDIERLRGDVRMFSTMSTLAHGRATQKLMKAEKQIAKLLKIKEVPPQQQPYKDYPMTARVDSLGWITCPNCKIRFSLRDKSRWTGNIHLTCRQEIKIEEAS